MLPPEIITEILLRLPARSIGKFRCVSKLFCYLSSDPRFAKSHLDLTLRNDSARPSRRKLIVSSRNLYTVDLDSIGDRIESIGDLASVELDYPLKEDASVFNEMIRSYLKQHQLGGESCVMPKLDANSSRRSWVEIIGSSHGLVCISPRENDVYLYNPTTGESKRLPESPFPEPQDQFQSYGFGFDDENDDYKVVNLTDTNRGVMIASVYSLKADSYRRICDLSYTHSNGFDSGVHFNGSIHWVFTRHHRVLVAFDLRTEEFREMQLPNEAEACGHRFKSFVIGNLKGRLCVVNSCYQEHDDIWVMNEYGKSSSWSRIRISLLYRSMKPLCSSIRDDEEALLELDGEMVLYNFKTHVSRNIVIRGVKPSDGFEANTYIESLISPNSLGI